MIIEIMLNHILDSLRIFKRYTKNQYYNLVFRLLRIVFIFVKKESSLTCYSGKDGGGAQLQRIISCASLCHYLGIKFVFTPIRELDFFPKQISKESWIYEWNNLINFHDVYSKNSNYELDQQGLFSALFQMIFKVGDYAISDAHKFADSHPNEYDKLISSTGLKIFGINEIDSSNSNSINNYIMHYRVPIVNAEHANYNSEKKRRVSTDKFIDTIELIKAEHNLNDDSIKVLLFDLKGAPAEILSRYSRVSFDDSTNAIDAIRLMTSAEVLVVSYSSMSYLAALFNQNNVYYYRGFWHSPKRNWKGIK